jgi:hypothetical protein
MRSLPELHALFRLQKNRKIPCSERMWFLLQEDARMNKENNVD